MDVHSPPAALARGCRQINMYVDARPVARPRIAAARPGRATPAPSRGGAAIRQAVSGPVKGDLVNSRTLAGAALASAAAIPRLCAGDRGGSIIITSSAAGLKAYPHCGPYVSAEHGVVGLMRTLALELAADLIRANSVHPTNVDTALIHNY
jgi:NAD(P)-dependent dehydrogenase (short-subunit alcohol dehydrogenase family)